MRTIGMSLVVIIFLVPPAFSQEGALKTQKDKVSYSMGLDIGKTMKMQGVDVDPDLLARGIKDVLTEQKLLMTDAEVMETLNNFKKEFMAKKQEEARQLGEKNKKEAEVFFAENKKKEGVKTLPSGLQYKVTRAGTGKKPKATDTVTVHYQGRLISGKEFDSSYRRGSPATLGVDKVIPGWTEALQLMQEGAKWELFIPSNLAYGERGAGPDIGPNAALLFDVELISVQEKK